MNLASLSSSLVYWDQVWKTWVKVRGTLVAPALRVAIAVCMTMSVMLLVERLLMGLVSLFAKVFRWRPARRYKWEPMKADEELGNLAYPMVLVQVPMYNERQVYKLSIGAACRLVWPLERLIVQILDDSTDPEIKNLVVQECKMWASTGVNIKYEIRDNRAGYKAGALREGMKHDYVQYCDYIAIFDADFQPQSDYLIQTVPFLVHNPNIALVQARWKYVNSNECLLTRIQEMSLDYHFKVEQESGSTMSKFFGFNGTAGVWRISALNEAGGWKDRTTVEDMDLAVRATLAGWDFLYVGDVKVRNELPSTFLAYRNQQWRWSCGPANLFRKISVEILRTKKVSLWKKLYLVYCFFFVRKVVAHVVTFTFYSVVIPVSVLVPEVTISNWGVIYIPTVNTLLSAVGTPSSFHLLFLWVFFENVMSMLRLRAVFTGLSEFGKVNEWVVTEKLGGVPEATEKLIVDMDLPKALGAESEATEALLVKEAAKQPPMKKKKRTRLFVSELVMAVFLFTCGCYDFKYSEDRFYFYIFPQSVTFFIMGLGFVGV